MQSFAIVNQESMQTVFSGTASELLKVASEWAHIPESDLHLQELNGTFRLRVKRIHLTHTARICDAFVQLAGDTKRGKQRGVQKLHRG